MRKVYWNFEDIEQDVAEKAPPVVYKYRVWSDKYHQGVLKDQQVYFSHPHTLNDSKDLRPEFAFNVEEVKDIRYFHKLLSMAPMMFPHYNYTQLIQASRKQWEETKADPSFLIEQRHKFYAEPTNYDPFGVLSTGDDPLNDTLWKRYSENYKGFVIGFKTVPFAKAMDCGFGKMDYSDAPFEVSFIEQRELQDLLYYKKTEWAFEKEFRFITMRIVYDRDRTQTFPWEAVADLTLGHEMPAEHQQEILDIMRPIAAQYNIPVYITRIEQGQVLRDRIL